MLIESLLQDVRYGLRGIQRAPLFAASVASTIGLGLGVLCSAFTIVNAYLLKPIDLPNPHELYAVSWDTSLQRRHGFRLADFEAARVDNPMFSDLAAGQGVTVMHDGMPVAGQIVTGNYFQLLGGLPLLGRTILPDDVATPGARAVVVLSHDAWRSQFGANPGIVGTQLTLGQQRFEVVGVMQPGFVLPGDETVAFWAPLTMARAFAVADPWRQADLASLSVVGRLREGATEPQARSWFDAWLRQRFPAGRDAAPVAVRVESRATRIPLNDGTMTIVTLSVAAFGLVLLVACANVTNMMLARALSRHRELTVRLALGASRARVVRQLMIESLLLAVPAVLFGLAITFITARVFPFLILRTSPAGLPSLASFLAPLDPDLRVLGLLVASAVVAAVIVGVSPAMQITRTALAGAVKGQMTADARVSRLRSGLVTVQIGACALFLVGATGFIDESRRLAKPKSGLEHEQVVDVRIAPALRTRVAERLLADPAVQDVAAAWRPPLAGSLPTVTIAPSAQPAEQSAAFMAVSPEYFAVFGIRIVRGRPFSREEADENLPVVVVSERTAGRFWPGQDPIGQTLDIRSSPKQSMRRPEFSRVQVIGMSEDVISGTLIEGTDDTCVYFPASLRSPGELSMLIRARSDVPAVKRSIAEAVRAVQPEASFHMYVMREMVGVQAWAFSVLGAVATLLAAIGLLLAFSGTYAVVAFLVAQRTREFGIRIALGTTAQRIVGGMLAEALRTGALGVAAGLVIAAGLVRASGAAIDMMPAFGPRPFVAGAVIVLAATIMAALLPSFRAVRVDPSASLRSE